MTALRFDGVIASTALPMTTSFQPDHKALREYVTWLLGQGVIGLAVNADTGEGAHLSRPERLTVVETVRDAAGDHAAVVSGLIAGYTDEAVRLARDIKAAGADGLLVFPPPAFVGDPLPPELVCRYYASVAETGLPLIAFNLAPALGGVVLGPATLTRLCGAGLIAAVKEASFDAATYVASRDAVRAAARPVALLSGNDNFIYESFLLGADGCLLGYAGLAADLTCRVLAHVKGRNLAEGERLARDHLQPLAQVLFAPPMRNSRGRIKEGLALLGVIKETTVRPPLLPLDPAERAAVASAMKAAGLL